MGDCHMTYPKSNAFKHRVRDDENMRMHVREFALGLVQQIPVRIDSLVSMNGTDSGRSYSILNAINDSC